ncbi:MAG: TIR domain-containing protein [Ignavibacteriae bacterium]|nr:TIR domain-containing protein [Ignavibacteriota bacterium]
MDKTKNVFISHYSKDEKHIGRLKQILEKKGYHLKNSSIDSSKPNFAKNPEYVKRLLRMRIHWAGTFICLVGPKTHTREWVDWEIEQAHKKEKDIRGIYLKGAEESNVPDNFNKYGNSLVTWDTNKIIDSLEGKINNWEKPDGSPRDSYYKSIHGNC